uniref:polyphenol oxidase family protein n=1 Tax=Stenotrophomonas cyclobalanopsidis TaxID=2771362 RepID=UPI002FD9B509
VFAAVDGSEIGAAHAGWRGLADGMLEDTVSAMNTPAAQLRAWLGPAAGPQDYEIGEEVYHAFVGHDPGAEEAFVATREGHWKVDLFALARQRLQAAGLDPLNIHGGTVSTMADPDLYSHRRDRRTGRMATLVWMA